MGRTMPSSPWESISVLRQGPRACSMVLATGSEEIDAGICHVALGDVEQLTALGGAGEVVVMMADWHVSEEARAWLARRVAKGDDVIPWGRLPPS